MFQVRQAKLDYIIPENVWESDDIFVKGTLKI